MAARLIPLIAVAALFAAACGSDATIEVAAEPTATPTPEPTATPTPEPTATPTAEPTATPEPTPTPTTAPEPGGLVTDAPCDDFAGFAAAGDVLAMVAVPFDGGLALQTSLTDADAPVYSVEPPRDDLVATGDACLLPDRLWYGIVADDRVGWADAANLAFLGATGDATAQVTADNEGVLPAGATVEDVVAVVIDQFTTDDPPTLVVQVSDITEGDLIEVIYDVVDVPDDSVRGFRLHLFIQSDESTTDLGLKSVELTVLCRRGATEDGICI